MERGHLEISIKRGVKTLAEQQKTIFFFRQLTPREGTRGEILRGKKKRRF